MFKVFYKYSACIKICADDISILCDPWFSENAYYGTWHSTQMQMMWLVLQEI